MEWKLVARKMVYHNSGRVDIEEWHSTSPTVITVSHLNKENVVDVDDEGDFEDSQ